MNKTESKIWSFFAFAVGGYAIYKVIDDLHSQSLSEESYKDRDDKNKPIYFHKKIKDINYNKLLNSDFGLTQPIIDTSFITFKGKDGKYRAKVTKFQIKSQIYINGNSNKFNHISQFQQYYKKNKNYTSLDYDPSFNTIEGTIYHETLHQEDLDKVITDFKPYIENSINKISFQNEIDTRKNAENILNNYKNFIEGKSNKNLFNSEASEVRHEQIELLEWLFLHDQYEKWLHFK